MQCYMNLENNQAFPDPPEYNLSGLLPDTRSFVGGIVFLAFQLFPSILILLCFH